MTNSNPVTNVGVPGALDTEESKSPTSIPIEEKLQKALDKALYANGNAVAQKIRNFLNGTWLGEPLHAALTDIPIGAWTAAMAFDALDVIRNGEDFAVAADTSIAIGMAGAVGSALTGLTDWSDVNPPARRTGLIHGLLNISSTTLFTTSLILRRKGSRTGGRIASMLGYAVMCYSAHLGGKLVYEYGVGVDRTAGEVFPQEFVGVMAESQLAEATPTRATHNGVPILLVRRGERIFAMAETCSHFEGPLSEGKLVGDSIVCPLHASRFSVEDGRVLDGPAVHPQPCLDVRVRNGQIEVRKQQVRS